MDNRPHKMLKINTLYTFLFLLLLGACDIKKNSEIEIEKASLVKIYDNNLFNEGYMPLDIKQTADGGFLILGSTRIDDSDFLGIYILKVDEKGEFITNQVLPSEYVHPAYNLMQQGDNYYFFCMQGVSLTPVLVTLDNAGNASYTTVSGGEGSDLAYPLHASMEEDGSLLLQSYDKDALETVFSRMGTDGRILAQRSFSIGAGEQGSVEENIIDHFTATGKQFPFLAGKTGDGRYFFNGFYNYTFSTVFFDLESDDAPGVLQGVHSEAGVSALLPLTGTAFASSRFSFGENYILPQVDIQVTEENPDSSEDLEGNPFPELTPDAKVILKRIVVREKNVLLYASDTKGRQIILMAYDEETGVLLGTKYLGFSNPYEVGGFTTTIDGGLAVTGTTYVAGRFPRVCLFKLTEEDLFDFAGQE